MFVPFPLIFNWCISQSVQNITELTGLRNAYVCTILFPFLDFTLTGTIHTIHTRLTECAESHTNPICPHAFRETFTPVFDVSDSSVGPNVVPFSFSILPMLSTFGWV